MNRYREIAKTLTATGWVFMLTIILIAACTLIFGCHGEEEEHIESMVVPEVPAPEEPEVPEREPAEEPEVPEREPAEERDPVEEPVELEEPEPGPEPPIYRPHTPLAPCPFASLAEVDIETEEDFYRSEVDGMSGYQTLPETERVFRGNSGRGRCSAAYLSIATHSDDISSFDNSESRHTYRFWVYGERDWAPCTYEFCVTDAADYEPEECLISRRGTTVVDAYVFERVELEKDRDYRIRFENGEEVCK